MTNPPEKPLVLVITGPTASGKSALALELARRLDGEIISADSMQVYRRLDIGTAKPTPEERAEIPHHLIDIRDPWESFSLADYLELAKQAIDDMLKRGRLPVLCGGTGLYIKALADGLEFTEKERDPGIRLQLEQRAREEGIQALYRELTAIDPLAAGKIHPHNEKRVIRALEIFLTSGRLPSDLQREALNPNQPWQFEVFLPHHDRDVLYRRIEERVDRMVSAGVLEEAAWLLGLNLPADSTCLQAIGYKEFFPYLRGEETLAEALTRLKTATRRYAKRQLTWYRPLDWVRYLPAEDRPGETARLADLIMEQLLPWL